MSDTEKNIKKAADTYLQALVAAVANNEKALAMALVQKALSGDMQALKKSTTAYLVPARTRTREHKHQ